MEWKYVVHKIIRFQVSVKLVLAEEGQGKMPSCPKLMIAFCVFDIELQSHLPKNMPMI